MTFVTGVTSDLVVGISDILKLGTGTAAAIDDLKSGNTGGAIDHLSQDGGRVGGVILSVVGAADGAGAKTTNPSVEPYDRSAYGNPSSSTAAKSIRDAGEGQACPGCNQTMKSGTKTAPTAEHQPTLKSHWHSKGNKMSAAERRAYARSPESMKGSLCKTCQSKQGAAESQKVY
jgi:hypothetical protein